MLVDKLQSAADFRTLKELPEGYLEEIARGISGISAEVDREDPGGAVGEAECTKGREEARVALVEAILELLADKGTIPKTEEEIIRKETDLEILKKC